MGDKGYAVDDMTFAQEEEIFPSLPDTVGELLLPEQDTDAATTAEKVVEEKKEANLDKKRKSSEIPTEKKVNSLRFDSSLLLYLP